MIPDGPLNKMVPLTEDHGGGGGGARGPPLAHGLHFQEIIPSYNLIIYMRHATVFPEMNLNLLYISNCSLTYSTLYGKDIHHGKNCMCSHYAPPRFSLFVSVQLMSPVFSYKWCLSGALVNTVCWFRLFGPWRVAHQFYHLWNARFGGNICNFGTVIAWLWYFGILKSYLNIRMNSFVRVKDKCDYVH